MQITEAAAIKASPPRNMKKSDDVIIAYVGFLFGAIHHITAYFNLPVRKFHTFPAVYLAARMSVPMARNGRAARNVGFTADIKDSVIISANAL